MKSPTRLLSLTTILTAKYTTLAGHSYVDHTPRDGDRLHPGLTDPRSLILSVDDTARTVVLDPAAISFDEDSDAYPYIDTDTISYVQFATKHRFIFRGDTLSYIGYENRATDFRLDSAVNVAVFPLIDRMDVRGAWTGHVFQYGAMTLRHVMGVSSASAEGGWTLTDGTDTVRNVVRLRWTLDMAYADPDSVTAAMPDSVASGIISEMQVDARAMLSERLLTERTVWFAEDARYPVLTESRVSRVLLDGVGVPTDTVPLTGLAMHYPASFQHSDTGEDVTAMRPADPGRDSGYGGYGEDGGQTMTVGEPEARGGAVTVTLASPAGRSTATVTLFTDTGIRLTEPQEVTVGPVPQPYSIPVPSGWSGVVLLRVEAGEESYTMKAII